MIKLTVLDQSPVFDGQSNEIAVKRTIEMAKQVEKIGYYRFWVAEQHSMSAFASSSPEIVSAAILSQTSKIRVGVAGILVGHYAAIKVAESVAMLSAIGNGRFDFGIGRTPGAIPEVINELGNNVFMPDNLDKKSDEIFGYLDGLNTVAVVPKNQVVDERWILCGSVGGAVKYAAKNGLALSYAHFVNPQACVEAIQYYREHFKPSKYLNKPKVNIAINAVVADSDEQAIRLAQPALNYYVRSNMGESDIGFSCQRDAEQAEYNEQGNAIVAQVINAGFIGGSDTVKAKLKVLIEATDCDELTILSIVEEPKHQIETYQVVYQLINDINSQTDGVG